MTAEIDTFVPEPTLRAVPRMNETRFEYIDLCSDAARDWVPVTAAITSSWAMFASWRSRMYLIPVAFSADGRHELRSAECAEEREQGVLYEAEAVRARDAHEGLRDDANL